MKKLTSAQIIKDTHALVADKSRMDKFMRMLAQRWEDERKYEAPGDYLALYRKELKRAVPYAEALTVSKRPFGFKIRAGHFTLFHYAKYDGAFLVTGIKAA